MINFNGEILADDVVISGKNRSFLYGDGVFETVKIVSGKILFLEDHYFRLMSSMRVVRMEIPMDFTMEYFESQLLSVARAANYLESARARITVFRNGDGYYLPTDRTISFVISAEAIQRRYEFAQKVYEVDLYKDYFVTAQLLSSIKTTNRILNVAASIFASENGLDNCFLMNEKKNVIEAIQGNIFMLIGNQLITPPVSEGCINGVMRTQLLNLVMDKKNVEIVQEPISPFSLQKADEIFITNVIRGIQPVTKYRKKEYDFAFAAALLLEVNAVFIEN